jgi:mevalonate kinase
MGDKIYVQRTRQPVRASAPGKIILFGEHAVVHGKQAIATAIDRRTVTNIETRDGDGRICLSILDVKRQWTWRDMLGMYHELGVGEAAPLLSSDKNHPCSDPLYKRLLSHTDSNIVAIFLFHSLLLLDWENIASIPSEARWDMLFDIKSEIPIGSGLGSSAALHVSLIAGLLSMSEARVELQPPTLSGVNHWAFVGERCTHGTPSGIDNTVATYGGTIVYQKGMEPVQIRSRQSEACRDWFKDLDFLIVDTKISRSTAEVLAKPPFSEPIFSSIYEAIHQVVLRAQDLLIWSKNVNFDIPALHRQLEWLVQTNHHLLAALGTLHPALNGLLDYLCSRSIAGKITGAGHGGSFLILLPLNHSNSLISELQQKFPMFSIFSVKIDQQGVEMP